MQGMLLKIFPLFNLDFSHVFGLLSCYLQWIFKTGCLLFTAFLANGRPKPEVLPISV
jgi:hypothetical protein